MAELFTFGDPETVRKLNILVEQVNALLKLDGDIFIRTNVTPVGSTIRLNIEEVAARIPKFRGGGGGGGIALRRAFVKTTPGATTTLNCWLDVDGTNETDIECTIYGGGNLDEAHPPFVDGDPLWVAFNAIADEWQNVTRIDGSEECNT